LDSINPDKIIVYGKSIGGAFAIYIAQKFPNEIKCAIIENTFVSIEELVCYYFHLSVVKYLVKTKLYNDKLVKDITVPILFISAKNDELIPSSQMEKLYKECGSEMKRLLQFEVGGHLDLYNISKYYTFSLYF